MALMTTRNKGKRPELPVAAEKKKTRGRKRKT